MINISAATVSVIIGHSPTLGFIPFATIRSPGLLGGAVAEFLFATQWVAWIILAAVGAAAVFVGRTRGNRRTKRVGLGALGLLAVWVIAAMVVDTPQERLDAAHRALLRAAEAKDADAIVALLSRDFESPILNIAKPEDRKPAIDAILKGYPIRSNRILGLNSVPAGEAAKTTFSVLTELEGGFSVKTQWELEWTDEAGSDWRLSVATLLTINDTPAGNLKIAPGLMD